METTDLRLALQDKRSITAQEAWLRASAAQRRYWFPDGPPSAGTMAAVGPAAASWDDAAPSPAALDKARAAGLRAMQAGYGPSLRADGLVACGVCPACDAGYPERCRHPSSMAEARLRDAQSRDADRTRDQVVLAELEALTVELAARLG